MSKTKDSLVILRAMLLGDIQRPDAPGVSKDYSEGKRAAKLTIVQALNRIIEAEERWPSGE